MHLELGSINPFFLPHLAGSSFVTNFYVLFFFDGINDRMATCSKTCFVG